LQIMERRGRPSQEKRLTFGVRGVSSYMFTRRPAVPASYRSKRELTLQFEDRYMLPASKM